MQYLTHSKSQELSASHEMHFFLGFMAVYWAMQVNQLVCVFAIRFMKSEQKNCRTYAIKEKIQIKILLDYCCYM